MSSRHNKLRERIVRYRGKDIIINFHVDRCTHVAECLMGLPQVFNNFRKPWVTPDAADADRVARIILKCPTGALHFKRLDGGWEESPPEKNEIVVMPDGPYYVSGDMELVSPGGNRLLEETRIALCRCGATQHPPFCDGMHGLADFKDEVRSEDMKMPSSQVTEGGKLKIVFTEGGPYQISGPVTIMDNRRHVLFQGHRASLCSCGKSRKNPYCDGSHQGKTKP